MGVISNPKRLGRSWFGYDRLAEHYGWMERLVAGKKLQGCREVFLHRLNPRRVLILGEAYGPLVPVLLRRYPDVEITCVDRSARMLAVLQKRLQRMGLSGARLQAVEADFREWKGEAVFDLVVTQFFLSEFSGKDLETICRRAAGSCGPGGSWLLADFQRPESGLRRWRAAVILWAMFRFFHGLVGIQARAWEDPRPRLQALDFWRELGEEREWGLLYSELWRREG